MFRLAAGNIDLQLQEQDYSYGGWAYVFVGGCFDNLCM